MKKILKCVGSIALAVCIALGCFFIPKNLTKNQRFLGTSLETAGASVNPPSIVPPDFTYPLDITFSGSDTFLIQVPYINNTTPVTDFSKYLSTQQGHVESLLDVLNFRFSFQIGTEDFRFLYSAVRYSTGYIASSSSYSPNSSNVPLNSISLPLFSISSLYNSFVSDSIFNFSSITPLQQVFYNGSRIGYVNFGFEIYKDNRGISEFVEPTFEMVSVELLNSYQFESKFGYSPSFSNSNIIRYTDTVGYSYSVYIPNSVDAEANTSLPWWCYYLTYRKYLLPAFFQLTDNSIYQQGVSDGYAIGVPDGYNQGYSLGLEQGNTEGFNNGYVEGLNTANNFTFQSLIGAVFDAPLNTFVGLFNFEILGVNLLSFITSILTFAITIFILSKILGGK